MPEAGLFATVIIMLRIVVVLGIISFFAIMPLYMFEQSVLPQLLGLKQVYGNLDDTVSRLAEPK